MLGVKKIDSVVWVVAGPFRYCVFVSRLSTSEWEGVTLEKIQSEWCLVFM